MPSLIHYCLKMTKYQQLLSYIVNCPTRQSLLLFIGSLHWLSIFPNTQVTRKYSTAMCYDQQQLDQVYGTSEARDGNVKLCWGFRKPTSVSAKKVEQMYPSTTHQLDVKLWILHKLHKIVFQSLFQARLWEGSEIILCAGFCLLLSLSLPFTWNNELQPLAILKCNHCDGILGAMSILQIHKKCPLPEVVC